MIKKLLQFSVLAFAVILTACEKAEISMVKEASCEYDQSKTWGQIFDSYQFITDGEWTLIKTEDNQELVRFTAKYDIQGFFAEMNGKNNILPADMIQKAGENFKSQPDILLLADFVFTPGKKHFALNYLGLEAYGKSPVRHRLQIDADIKSLIQNKPLSLQTLEAEGQRAVSHALAKAMLDTVDIKNLQFAAACDFSVTQGFSVPQNILEQNPYSPMIIYTVKDMRYDEKTQDIFLQFSYDVTDTYAEQDTVLWGGEIAKNLGNAKILYSDTMEVKLDPIKADDFYGSLIYDQYWAVYFSDGKTAAVGMFFCPDQGKFAVSPINASPSADFQEFIDKYLQNTQENTLQEEIYINEIKFFGADIIVGFCISETDNCGELLVPADSDLYTYIAHGDDVLFHTFYADISEDGTLLGLEPTQ